MPDRSQDWFAQAERDLRHAVHAREDGDFEWACFAAQQADEKAVKALHLRCGLEGWGHSVKQLMESLPDSVAPPPDLREAALLLDRHYVPTRYPNGFAQGMPGDYFVDQDAEAAIRHAARILEFVRGRLGV